MLTCCRPQQCGSSQCAIFPGSASPTQAHAACHVSHASPAGLLPLAPPPHDAGSLLAGKLVQWVARRWTEYASGARQRRRELQACMDSASSYKEWAQAAQEVRHGWPAEA